MRRFGGYFGRSRDASEGDPGNAPPGPRFSAGAWCLAAAVIGSAVLIYLTLVDIENDKKLATIRAAVEDYASHIKSLEGQYEMAFTANGQYAGSNESMTVDFAADLTKQRMIHDEHRVQSSPKSPAITRRTRRLDAENALLTFTPRDGAAQTDWGEPHTLYTQRRTNPKGSTLWHLAGLAARHQAVGGLARLWSSATENWGGDAKYEGKEQMNGALCERVTIRFPGGCVRLWLDPARDYLPRRQEFIKIADGNSGKSTTDVIDSFEFAKYHDAEADVMRWFPSRGRDQWKSIETAEYVLKQLTINPPLDDKRFQVDIASLPDGVQVIDNQSAGGTSYTGDRRDLWEARERARVESRQEATLKGLFPQSTGIATPGESDIYRDAFSRLPWWVFPFVAAAIGLLIVLVVVRVRRARPTSV